MNKHKKHIFLSLIAIPVVAGILWMKPTSGLNKPTSALDSSPLLAQVAPTTYQLQDNDKNIVSPAAEEVKFSEKKVVENPIKEVASKSTVLTPESKLAQCLTKNGVKFYGAFWCSHCQKQKKLFGQAVKELPYVECSTPNGKAQTSVCIDAGITSYPTWKFPDGSEQLGEMTLEELSTKTNCPLD